MATADQPDAVLASDAKNGSRQAFDQLVIRHKAQIYRIARHYIGNESDALDIVQDTFVAAWLGLRSYDTARDLGAWLRTIALNKCRDLGRRQTVRRGVMRLYSLLDVHERTEPSADVAAERLLSETERLQALDRAIALLPAAQKEVLVLTAFAGLSQQEAARQLKTSVKSVEMKVRRAKHRLEQLLRSDGV